MEAELSSGKKNDLTLFSSAAVRAEAARAVARVMAGRTLDDALREKGDAPVGASPFSLMTTQNRSLLKAMAYGVVREHTLLTALAARLLDKPLDKAPEVQALLLCGLQQLRSMRMPAHAAVAETVNAVGLLEAHWARGMVNAVLRRYQRERRALEDALPSDPVVRLSHPTWLVDAIRRDWPRAWKRVLLENNEQAPLTLRANRRRGPATAYLQQELPGAGLRGHIVDGAPDAIVLDEAVPVDELPGFAEGQVSVQDAAAQLAVELLDLKDGLRVLDACAAPGGKTAHILERASCEVLALDVDAQRLKRVEDNLARLQLAASVRAGDARDPRAWWDGKPFDRILVDAPCSGTGVIRRHPDIKWLRRREDLPRMAQSQLDLLHALWPLLAPGGTLLYAVCSVLAIEGPRVVERFFEQQPAARARPIDAAWGEAQSPGRRLAPGGDFDGFFYARLEKTR
jgi:16S rRNA (cytosine967-C5)-methyltransferase